MSAAHVVGMATWILVAQRAGARLLERTELGAPPKIIRHIDHAEGKLLDAQLGTGRAGVAHDSGGHHGVLATEESPSERITAAFARTLAGILERGRLDARYQNLVIIAEPKLLGALRKALPETARRMVRDEVGLDLGGVDDNHLIERVGALLPSARRAMA
jgi:protein required for attachment to host cells